MPRGKNYVNNNRGLFLQSAKNNKKKASSMEACFYGAACTRKDCIYRHDKPKPPSEQQHQQQQQQKSRSTEPCMAFLAGVCNLPAETCHKRHPSSKQEREDLIAHFSRIPCRYGSNCTTKACLYAHEPELDQHNRTGLSIGMTEINQNSPASYPAPLSGGFSPPWQPFPSRPIRMMPTTSNVKQSTALSAWKPAPGMMVTNSSVQQPTTSAWKPTPAGTMSTTTRSVHQPVASAWKPVPPTSSIVQQQQQQQQKNSSHPQLNAQAREFKPTYGDRNM